MDTAGARGPVLAGLYGKTRQLADGSSVLADDQYLRESILNPQAKLAAGFQPVMPTFQGQVSEDDLIRLISYVKSIPVATAQTPQVGSPASPLESRGAVPTTSAAPTTSAQGNQQP
jgi:cytochrome c oxidase subunit II